MPAAAVIPAPIAYIKVVAVKKLVVGFRDGPAGLPKGSFSGLKAGPRAGRSESKTPSGWEFGWGGTSVK